MEHFEGVELFENFRFCFFFGWLKMIIVIIFIS